MQRTSTSLTPVQMRAFGGAPSDPNHKYVYHRVDSQSTTYKVPSQTDMDYQLPKKGIFNEKLHQWIQGKWAVDRDEVLDNTKVNKYSAYYHFGSNPLLQNSMIWKLASSLSSSRAREADKYGGLSGVVTHENGIHLYKSPEAKNVVIRQLTDYTALGFLLAWLSGVNPFIVMPLFYVTIQMPRKISTMKFFTWHAELLPHTEQVVLSKVSLFGQIERHYVDIRNLEKIDSDQISAPLMWEINMFDADLCFRDASTGEQFVFDRQGFWNKEALDHPLLN